MILADTIAAVLAFKNTRVRQLPARWLTLTSVAVGPGVLADVFVWLEAARQTGWWRTQSKSNPSPVPKFPANREINREFFNLRPDCG